MRTTWNMRATSTTAVTRVVPESTLSTAGVLMTVCDYLTIKKKERKGRDCVGGDPIRGSMPHARVLYVHVLLCMPNTGACQKSYDISGISLHGSHMSSNAWGPGQLSNPPQSAPKPSNIWSSPPIGVSSIHSTSGAHRPFDNAVHASSLPSHPRTGCGVASWAGESHTARIQRA